MGVYTTAPERSIARIALTAIAPNPAQPRSLFGDEGLDRLADSISEHGLLSPLVVRRIDAGRYELIAGERRLRALKRLGRTHADALIVTAYDSESAVMALVENIQREQLHYLDEACACRAIIESQNITQEELAAKLGRSPSALANRLRLLRLCPGVKDMLRHSALTERHARALLSVSDADAQLEFARLAEAEKLTVRQLEQRIARRSRSGSRPVRCVTRDHRLYVNAVIDTLDRLRELGAEADSSVHETEAGTEIHILLKKRI